MYVFGYGEFPKLHNLRMLARKHKNAFTILITYSKECLKILGNNIVFFVLLLTQSHFPATTVLVSFTNEKKPSYNNLRH